MGRQKLEEKTVIIEWYSEKNEAFKAGDVYKMSDKVRDFVKKSGLKKGEVYNIKHNKDNVVSFLTKSKEETKSELVTEPKTASESTVNTVSGEEILTVARVAGTKKVISFEEKNEGKKQIWYHAHEGLVKAELNGVKAGQKVKVMLGEVTIGDETKTNGVIDIHPVEETTSTTSSSSQVTFNSEPTTNYAGSWAEKNDIERQKQESIVRQCAFKGACEVAKVQMEQGASIDDVVRTIEKVAEVGLKIIKG